MWKRAQKRVLGLLLLLCVFCYPLQPQELSFKHIDWEAVEGNLTSIEYNLKLLETNNKFLQQQLSNANQQLTNAQKQSEEQAKYSAKLQLQLDNLESKYEKSERAMKLWRGACVITTITTITAIAIILK